MISSVSFKRFKQFKNQKIELGGSGVKLLAGGNNSGKTSLFHGLTIWEFCRSLVQAEKGAEALLPGQKIQGVGISDHEFLPINIPDLSHLWTNLKSQKNKELDDDGYTLRIRCDWRCDELEKYLEFGLSLANDRLFVKTTDSNLVAEDPIPRVAYLPPFAGISSREVRLPMALRRRRVGEGLAGAVLRNTLLDLQRENNAERGRLREGKTKISDADLKNLRETDPWEVIQQVIREVFGAELVVAPFNEEYHSYIRVDVVKGALQAPFKLKRHAGYKARDLMVEGSGFLQWLSVFSLAADPRYDVLLLDEPDAHLHATLQRTLLDKLSAIGSEKLIMVATHSTEVLRWSPPEDIIGFRSGKPPRFLTSEAGKVGLIAGIGSVYLPRLDAIKDTKRVLFVEGEGDARALKRAAKALGRQWIEDWIVWPEKSGHADRVKLANALRQEIAGLKVVSIRDRDLDSKNSIGNDLVSKGLECNGGDFIPLTWKRRNLENYYVWPPAIAIACGFGEAQVNAILANEFGVAIGDNFRAHEAPAALLDFDGKAILARFGIKLDDISKNIEAAWISDDIVTVLDRLELLAAE